MSLQNSKDILALKPILPTQFWTFDNALSLLKSCKDPYILDALDEFLILNRQLLLDPSPFEINDADSTTKTSSKFISPDIKEISLRTITYTNITPSNIKDTKTIHNIVGLDSREILRVVAQTSKRVPERKLYDFDKLKSKLPDDREKYLEQERVLLYTNKVLRERRIVLRFVIELLNNKSNEFSSSKVQNLGREIFLSKDYINKVIDTIKSTLKSIATLQYGEVSSDLKELMSRESALFLIELLKVLIELTIQNPVINADTVQNWFELMGELDFLSGFSVYFKVQEAFKLVHMLSTIVSLSLLDLENAYDDADNSISETSTEDERYISSVTTFCALNSIITNSQNKNAILLYSWSIILLRKSYFLQDNPSPLSERLSPEQISSTINDLNARCVKLNVYHEIYKLNEALKFDNLYSAIISSVIISAMPLVSFTPQVTNTVAAVLESSPNSVIEKFFDNEAAINQIIMSRTKFPILLTPYLKIGTINGSFAFHEFNELKSFIQVFKKSDFESLYQIDDENTDLVSLTKVVDVYPPFEANKKLSLVLPEGTKAKILPTGSENDILVTFLYKYNGWAFLGRILQNVSRLYNDQDDDKNEFIVNLSNLISSVVKDTTQNQVNHVFESMSIYTDNSDILEVFLRLFESSLHARNVKVLESILNLLTQITPIFSHRIWPYLSKSSLLSKNGKEGFMSTIFGSIEMISGDYSFTIALIKFIGGLIQNCLVSKDTYPSKSKSLIMTKFTSHLLLIFESFTHCKFTKSYQKMEIGVLILDKFSSMLASVNGITNSGQNASTAEVSHTVENQLIQYTPGSFVSGSITSTLDSSSSTILESFLITKNEYSRCSLPILLLIEFLSTNMSLYELNDLSGFWYEHWIRCSLSFSQLIISIRSLKGFNPSSFERELFKKLPQLVSTYSQYEPLRKDIIDLIATLTNGKWDENKPSLLSHLGNDYSKILLSCLISDLDNSFDDYKLKVSLYDFICSVLEGGQEGLSVLFSGRDVFGTEKKEDSKSQVSLLSILKKNVKDIKYYPNAVSIHLLDALSVTYNSWNTIKEEADDIDFINDLISRIQLPMNDKPKTAEEYISRCYEQRIISKIGEILSLILFTTRNDQIKQKIIGLITSESFIEILKDKFTIEEYDPLLHSKVSALFEDFAPKFKLEQFTTALGKRNRFGVANVYNLGLMEGIFGGDERWPGVKTQIIEQSINIQHLNSQISITKSFGALLTVFCRKFSESLTPNMLGLVHHLLKVNYIEGIPSPTFEQIYHERIEVAFYLIYSITHEDKVKKDSDQVFEIIKVTLDLLSSNSLDFLSSLASSTGHYRQLLKIIYCCLTITKDNQNLIIEYFSVFKSLFDLLIARGTKVMLIQIQNEIYLKRMNGQRKSVLEDKTFSGPVDLEHATNDLILVLSILKLFIGLKYSNQMKNEIAQLINENGTIQALLHLYSLSHTIQINDEYIFAELALMFIQELMTIEVIAESFITCGLFVTLVESPISHPIRNGGLSVSVGPQYHKLWINGILPIFILSLNVLGLKVLKEVSLGLQMFGKQIESCIESWSKDSSSIKITTAVVIETSQILLLYESLQSMNIRQVWNDYEEHSIKILPGLDTESKREEFLDYVNNLLKHPKFLTSRVLPSSSEEQRIIEKGGASFDKFVNNLIEEIRELKDFLD